MEATMHQAKTQLLSLIHIFPREAVCSIVRTISYLSLGHANPESSVVRWAHQSLCCKGQNVAGRWRVFLCVVVLTGLGLQGVRAQLAFPDAAAQSAPNPPVSYTHLDVYKRQLQMLPWMFALTIF